MRLFDNIDVEYQKCLNSNNNDDINISSNITNNSGVNTGDKFTYTVEFSNWDKMLARLYCYEYVCKPKHISIFKNGKYDHNIVPTQCCDVIRYDSQGICPEAENYCKNLNKSAGSATDTHEYVIKRAGHQCSVRFYPEFGWGNEIEYKYDTIIDCLKHIVVNSSTYNDNEIAFRIAFYNANCNKEREIFIQNKAHLKQIIEDKRL